MKRPPRVLLTALTLVIFLFIPLTLVPTIASAAECRYTLGFKAIYDQIPDIVGNCKVNEHYNPDNGDALQETDNGLLVWRKADNFTAFTDGYRSWVNGPFGLQQRLNTERFEWEPVDPMALALALTDMPAGFSETANVNRYVYDQQVIEASRNPADMAVKLERWQYIQGYIATYDQMNAAGLRGTFMVINEVDVFGTAEGAGAYYAEWDANAAESLAMYAEAADLTLNPVSSAALGDESKAFRAIITVGEGEEEVSVTAYFIVFRKGTVVSTVSSLALTTFASFDDVLGYARTVEAKIR